MTAPTPMLRGKDRRYLRGLGNALRPTVYLGKEGLSAAVIRSLEQAYANSELVKVRCERNIPVDRRPCRSGSARAGRCCSTRTPAARRCCLRPSGWPAGARSVVSSSSPPSARQCGVSRAPQTGDRGRPFRPR